MPSRWRIRLSGWAIFLVILVLRVTTRMDWARLEVIAARVGRVFLFWPRSA